MNRSPYELRVQESASDLLKNRIRLLEEKVSSLQKQLKKLEKYFDATQALSTGISR